jgi:hypothetical protein
LQEKAYKDQAMDLPHVPEIFDSRQRPE